MQDAKEAKKNKIHFLKTGIGIVLCLVFGFMLIYNITIIVKSSLNPESPPSVFGVTPLVVLTESMSGDKEGHIEAGDLILVENISPDKLEIGNVISFREEGLISIVTHRIIDIKMDENGAKQFLTKGDANNTDDGEPYVTEDRVVGIYRYRIPGIGNFALFMQTPLGMFLFIGIPLFAFIIYDVMRRQHYANIEKKKAAEMNEELERLRAQVNEKSSE